MLSTQDYIRSLEKEIERLHKLVKFYEEIILSNDDLREKLKEKRKYYGNKDRRNHKNNKR